MRRTSVLVVLSVLFASTAASQGKTRDASSHVERGRQLSAPLVASVAAGDVSSYQASPDGAWIVYRANGDVAEVFELYCVPSMGGAVVQLSAPLVAGGNVAPDYGYGPHPNYAISPDSTRVVYVADQETDGLDELYSVPITGGAAVKLNAAFTTETLATFAISPDSSRVVYRTTEAVTRLLSVPIGGGTPLDLGPGGEFQISPDSSRVVYLVLQQPGVQELFSVPVTGGTATKLNPPLVSGGTVASFRIAPDASRVVYSAEQATDGVVELYSVPLGGGAASKISGTRPGIIDFAVSPDSSWVVFRAPSGGAKQLFGVAITGGTPATLNSALVPGGNVGFSYSPGYEISPDSNRVVFVADKDTDEVRELFGVPITGGINVRLNPAPGATQDVVSFRIVPDSSRAVFKSYDSVPNRISLFSVQTTGGTAVNIGGTLHHDSIVPQISADSGLVLLGVESIDYYSVPVAGGPLLELTQPRTPGSLVGSATILADSSTCVFLGNLADPESVELHSVPMVDGEITRLSASLPRVSTGDVFGVVLTPDASQAVYVADQEQEGKLELYRASIPGGEVAKLTPTPAGTGIDVFALLTPDGTRVVYRSDQDTPGRLELYSVAVAGGASVKLNGPVSTLVFVRQISPDSQRVVYEADQVTPGEYELHSVSVTGGPSTPLTAFAGQGGVGRALVSPDSSTVVFAATGAQSVYELYSVPITGGAVTKLNPALVPGGALDRDSFRISPDSTRVLYYADQELDGRVELYSVPIGGGSAVKLNGSIPSGGALVAGACAITPDSSWVVFRGSQASAKVELHGVPITGGTPVRLNGNLVSFGAVTDFLLSPDGARVVYVADQAVNERFDVHAVPTTGGASLQISGPLVRSLGTTLFAISPDSKRVVYAASAVGATWTELYSAPLAGGSVALTGSLQSGRSFTHVALTPDSRRVVYRADQAADDRFELFTVPLQGGAPVLLSGRLVAGGDVLSSAAIAGFDASQRLRVSSNVVLYIADQDQDEMMELYASYLFAPGPP